MSTHARKELPVHSQQVLHVGEYGSDGGSWEERGLLCGLEEQLKGGVGEWESGGNGKRRDGRRFRKRERKRII